MNNSIVITSLANPQVKRFKALATRRRQRYRDERFVAEGYRTVRTLLDNGSVPDEFIVGDTVNEAILNDLTEIAIDADAKVTIVAAHVARHISHTVNPQSVFAVFRMSRKELPEQSELVLLVDGVQDPGNLGSIIRTSVASGVDAVVTMPGSVDIYSPKVVRGSAGLVESLPVGAAKSLDEVLSDCFSTRPQILLASAAADVEYTVVDWTQPTILVVGNEARGPQQRRSSQADVQVRIPMMQSVESINVAAATAVLLFEANRQRTVI